MCRFICGCHCKLTCLQLNSGQPTNFTHVIIINNNNLSVSTHVCWHFSCHANLKKRFNFPSAMIRCCVYGCSHTSLKFFSPSFSIWYIEYYWARMCYSCFMLTNLAHTYSELSALSIFARMRKNSMKTEQFHWQKWNENTHTHMRKQHMIFVVVWNSNVFVFARSRTIDTRWRRQ